MRFPTLALGLVALLALMAPRRPRVAQLVFLVMVAFVLTNKVYSPQYVLWLSPLAVLEAYVAAAVAMVIFGIPAALQQHRHSPIIKDAKVEGRVDWARVGIVAIILARQILLGVL